MKKDISDMVSEADYRFFIEIKCRMDAKIEEQDNVISFESGKIKVVLGRDNDRISVIRDGITAGSGSISEFERKPNATFRILHSYMR